MAQEAPGTDVSLVDTVLAADTERLELLAQAEHETDGHKLGDIYHRLEAIDAYTAPARAAEILAGLGFSAEDQLRPCKEFSGGWRMRVALAAILFSAPICCCWTSPPTISIWKACCGWRTSSRNIAAPS